MSSTSSPWLTEPDHEDSGWPPGVPYIIGNEGCERFSFYGMKSILYVFLAGLYVQFAMENAEGYAQATVHLFIVGVYAFPMIGAIVADRLLGKYHTILYLSMVYVLGHACLAVFEGSLTGVYVGLALIAVGSGGIKPCVSAHVGDQFGKKNWFRLERVYQAFYFIINFGSTFATLSIPLLKRHFGVSVAFAVPGVLMAMATVAFWMGRKVFVHVPPKPGGRIGMLDTLSSVFLFMVVGSLFFTATLSWPMILLVSFLSLVAGLVVFQIRQKQREDDGFLAITLYSIKALLGLGGSGRELPASDARPPKSTGRMADLSKHWFFGPAARHFGQEAAEGPVAVFKIISVFLMVSVFWALFDQHASSWIRQAELMNRWIVLPLIGAYEILPSQTASLNPVTVMILIPIMTYGVYPLVERLGIKFTPLRRMSVGMMLASLSFVSVALVQASIDAGKIDGYEVHVYWQSIAYLLITLAEVMVSITGLEFAYSQAPKRMKSTIMAFWMLTVALGNVLVAFLSTFERLALVNFFWVFAGLMFLAGLLFAARAAFYKYQDYTQ